MGKGKKKTQFKKKVDLAELQAMASEPAQADPVMELLPSAPKGSTEFNLDDLPENPPFVAYVGNLAYEVDERGLEDFFNEHGAKVESASIQREDGRHKGFGYVHFQTRMDLKTALEIMDKNFGGREIKIDLKRQSDRGSGFGNTGRHQRTRPPVADNTPDDWRSARDSTPRERPSFRDGPPRDRPYDDGPRGPRDGPPRDRYHNDGPRNYNRSYDDGPRRSRDGPRDGPRDGYHNDGPRQRRDMYHDGPRERNFRDGPRDRPSRYDRPPRDDRSERSDEPMNWRKGPARPGSERPKFQNSAAPERQSKSNPFGSARPVDTTKKYQEVEERLQKTAPSSKAKEDPKSKSQEEKTVSNKFAGLEIEDSD